MYSIDQPVRSIMWTVFIHQMSVCVAFALKPIFAMSHACSDSLLKRLLDGLIEGLNPLCPRQKRHARPLRRVV